MTNQLMELEIDFSRPSGEHIHIALGGGRLV
jgi:hypothetical protein